MIVTPPLRLTMSSGIPDENDLQVGIESPTAAGFNEMEISTEEKREDGGHAMYPTSKTDRTRGMNFYCR